MSQEGSHEADLKSALDDAAVTHQTEVDSLEQKHKGEMEELRKSMQELMDKMHQ